MDTAQFFSAADAFVMSSRSEGLPMSLLQAMSLGLPAVLTDTDGGAEVVRLFGTGCWRRWGMRRDWRGDRPGGGRCGVAGRVCAEGAAAYASDFTLETMGAGYMRLYLGKG